MLSTPPPARLRQALSGPRLALYQSFFKTTCDEATLGAYQWHEAVRSSMMPLLGLVEVVVRNTVHHALSQQADGVASASWFDSTHPRALPLSGAPRRLADDLLQATDDGGFRLVQSPDDFVANATFGFWVDVLRQIEKGRRYRLAKAMFPGFAAMTRPADWQTPQPWDSLVTAQLRQHKKFRDWVAHFNPLWKWKYRDAAGKSHMPSSPGAAMLSLRQEATRMATTLGQVDPSFAALWVGTYSQAHFFQLTTTKALFHFQKQFEVPPPAGGQPDPRFALCLDLWTDPGLPRVGSFVKRSP